MLSGLFCVRYSEEQSTSPDQSTIDWLELTNAFEELELNQSGKLQAVVSFSKQIAYRC